jgi:cytochrome P450 family 90 subfamily A polypeptide 1
MGELSYYSDNNLFGSIVASNMGLALLMITTIIVMLCGWFFLQRKTKAPLPPGRLGLPFIGETLELMTALQNNNLSTFFNSRVAKYGEVHP